MAKNICYYISDHGYGHAARSIAVIRALLNAFSDIHIFVKAFTAYDLLKNSLQDKRIDLIQQKNDVGVIANAYPFDVMRNESLDMIQSWFKSWPEYIRAELDFCRKKDISLIITDVAPQPIEIARELGITSVLISNFTWENIYEPIFGKQLANELALMKKTYAKADIAFVLPFEQEIKARKVIHVGLIAKDITASKQEIKKLMGINQHDFVAYFGMGFSMPEEIINKMHVPEDVKILVSSNIPLSGKGIIKIPSNVTESQNYIAMCDLAVIKSGYTTVAEAIRGHVPLLITKRDGFNDDTVVCDTACKMGIAEEISNKIFINGEWIKTAKEKSKTLSESYNHLPERFKNSGIPQIISEIRQLLI